MIGMMNNNQTDHPEFFAGRPRQEVGQISTSPDHIQLMPVQKKLSYTDQGRRLVDGEPEQQEDPAQMWGKLMLRVNCQRAVEEGLKRAGRRKNSTLIRLLRAPGNSIRTMLTGGKGKSSSAPGSSNISKEGGGQKQWQKQAEHQQQQGSQQPDRPSP